MSTETTASAPKSPTSDPEFDRLVSAVQKRFARLTGGPGAVHLFYTRAPELAPMFLQALPEALRGEHDCHVCRRFLRRFGGLARVEADGAAVPVLWAPEEVPERYRAAALAMAGALARAPIEGVFLSSEAAWGQPVTGGWTHLAVVPGERCVFGRSLVETAGQAAAAKREDHRLLLRGLEDFSVEVVRQAHTLLTTGALYRSEKCIGVAKWLLDLHEQRQATTNVRARDNLTWLAVAGAPAGFCHVGSTMIGSLLEDLALGFEFAELKARFDAKMHPLQYQRPTAAPAAGNIAQAEKLVEQLKSAGALERRFARLADLETLWRPAAPGKSTGKGVFSQVKGKQEPTPAGAMAPPVVMTWDKFSRTILPTAERVEFLVPAANQHYAALVTAKHADAPPILQWDAPDLRNPVSWYFYSGGSTPARWGLTAGAYHPVSAVTLQPSMWHGRTSFAHHGEKVFFILEGARDREYTASSGFFPEFMKREYHPVRATIEAFAKSAVIAGKDEAEACGIGLQKGLAWNLVFRVFARAGVRVDYKLDRWD